MILKIGKESDGKEEVEEGGEAGKTKEWKEYESNQDVPTVWEKSETRVKWYSIVRERNSRADESRRGGREEKRNQRKVERQAREERKSRSRGRRRKCRDVGLYLST